MNTAMQAAHDQAMRTPVVDLATACQRLFGQRAVAYVAGHKTPQIVGRWAAGYNEPNDEARARLRALYRTVLILEEREQPDTIRAWMLGANPQLDDRAPLELLHDDEFVPVYKAAENFAHS